MSNPPAPGAAPGAGALDRRPTWPEVVDMYKELGLRVCDDPKAITESYDKKVKRYVLDAESPDQSISAKARLNMKNGTRLKNDAQRRELLEIGYQVFAGRCKVTCLANVAAKNFTFTPALRQSLITDVAQIELRCRDDLAEAWMDRWQKETNTRIEDDLRPTAPVLTGLRALGGVRQVKVTWDAPKDPLDHIEIRRDGESSARAILPGRPVTTSYHDTNVPAGTRKYSLRTVRGDRQGDWQTIEGVSLDEVTAADAKTQGAEVVVSWSLPFKEARIAVFRRVGASPVIRAGPQGPEGDSQSVVLTRGASPKTDRPDVEGQTVFYRLVVYDASGTCTPGTELRVDMPKVPPPPGPAQAAFAWSNGAGTVRVTWQPAPRSHCEYVVVRRAGANPPAHVKDGESSPPLSATAWDDRSSGLVAGKRYTYGVFSTAAGLPSSVPSVAPTVEILAEVSHLTESVEDDRVELHWHPPANVVDVRVRRSVGQPPRTPTDGASVPVRDLSSVLERDLVEGQTYHYRIFCVFKMDDGTLRTSSGVGRTVTPAAAPELIRGFQVVAVGGEVRCGWDPPRRGRVEVWRTAQAVDPANTGRVVSTAQVAALLSGKAVSLGVMSSQAVDAAPKDDAPYYSPVVICGSRSIIGRSVECHACDGVKNLALVDASDREFLLRWELPARAVGALVLYRPDDGPLGPDDAGAKREIVTRAQLERTAGLCRIPLPPGWHQVQGVVLARHAVQGGRTIYSCADDPGAAFGPVACLPRMRLSYEVAAGNWLSPTPKVRLRFGRWRPGFRGVVVIAGREDPVLRGAGFEVGRHEIAPEGEGNDFEVTIRLSMDEVKRAGWAKCWLQVFAAEASEDAWMSIEHPENKLLKL